MKHMAKKKRRKPTQKPIGINLNITVDQFNEAVRRQVLPAVDGLRTNQALRDEVLNWGVDPDELAKDIEKDIPPTIAKTKPPRKLKGEEC